VDDDLLGDDQMGGLGSLEKLGRLAGGARGGRGVSSERVDPDSGLEALQEG
jgi:hypothetical protein